MQVIKKYIFLVLIGTLLSKSSFTQEVAFSPTDSLHTYHIVTMKDGSVLKGKIIRQDRKTIQFQDEIIGNVTFRTKDVSSMEHVEPQEYYLITLMNGSSVQGKILNRKEKEILVETTSIGTITIDVSKIKIIKNINPGNMKDGRYWFKSHIDAHYFMLPSAIPLSPGEAYFQNTLGLYNAFNVAVTNHFSCTGGIVVPMAAFIGSNLNYKIMKGVYVGAGAMFVDITGAPYGGAAYGQCTIGNRNTHLSVGAGYGFVDGLKKYYYLNKVTKVEVKVISASAMKRLSPKYAIVTENWFTPDEGIRVFTGGVRLMSEKGNWDFGIASISIAAKIIGTSNTLGPIAFISYMRNL